MKNDIHDLGLVLDSKVKLVLIESWEEARVLELITGLAIKRSHTVYQWTDVDGLQRLGFGADSADAEASQNPEEALKLIRRDMHPNLYVLCDVHPYLNEQNPKLIRLLKEVAMRSEAFAPTLILLSHAMTLPPEVRRYAARFELALPSEDELGNIVRDEAARWTQSNQGLRVRTDNRTLGQLVKNLRGLTHGEARVLARKVIVDDGAITQEDIPELNKAKFELLDLEGVLSFEYDTARFADVGGLRRFKQWLGQRQSAFTQGGADVPRGVLLVGVQGGGKSLAAKAVAGLWGLPLLRLDFGALYNKYFGETERNLRQALKLASMMSPCVLWMDEIEKGMATGEGDGGVSQRVLGTLLTWMSERKEPVFIVATANAIDRLPPELVRKGRFDEMFFVDLPAEEVRGDIFRIHLERRELPLERFDLPALAAAANGFTGAEIEQAVVSAVYAAQAQEAAAAQAHVLQALRETSPLSVVMAEDLQALRHWAQQRTVPAD
ncbi:AAA family ATPase [Atopomonas sediminilitoris]|uniref:AAA family ATPase n=1 Tax=Atopomonas sediminilitoris TaxID=2919919 RepID=UPI001F4D6638|nr:AAA family ATPase [Atopomonas sediminilitoris]